MGRCSFLGLLHSEEAGKLYRVIRMQINELEERNLDDEETDGEVVEKSQMYVETMGLMKKTAKSHRTRTEAAITRRLSSAKKSTPCGAGGRIRTGPFTKTSSDLFSLNLL